MTRQIRGLLPDGTLPAPAVAKLVNDLKLESGGAKPVGAVIVTDYGAPGAGTQDDTTAIEAAWSAAAAQSRPLWFPPGRYNYNGAGLPGGGANIHGAGRDKTRIHLGPTSRLIDATSSVGTLDIGDFTLNGGIGLFRSTYTGNAVAGIYRVENIAFKGYTGACIEHNAVDMPYWKFRDLIFDGANFTTTMGIALSGLVDGCLFDNIEFLRNRVHIKMRNGAGNAYIRNCDFIRFGRNQGFPRIDVWVVPRNQSVNSGSGFTLSSSKFGGENTDPGDKRILYADEAAGASNGERFPVLDTASTGWVSEHTITDVMIGGESGAAAPMVYSTTPNVRGCRYGDIVFAGSLPRYVVEFLQPPTGDRLSVGSVVGPVVSAALGVEGDPAPEVSNAAGWAYLIDPNGVLSAAPGMTSATTAGAPVGYRSLLRTPTDPYTVTGLTVEPITDSLGGDDARRATTPGGGMVILTITNSTTTIRTGSPVWVEFDARAGTLTGLRLRLEQSGGTPHYQRVLRLGTGWHRYRFLWTPRGITATIRAQLFPLDNTPGTFDIGRIRLYHAQEPVNTDGLTVIDGALYRLALTNGALTATPITA